MTSTTSAEASGVAGPAGPPSHIPEAISHYSRPMEYVQHPSYYSSYQVPAGVGAAPGHDMDRGNYGERRPHVCRSLPGRAIPRAQSFGYDHHAYQSNFVEDPAHKGMRGGREEMIFLRPPSMFPPRTSYYGVPPYLPPLPPTAPRVNSERMTPQPYSGADAQIAQLKAHVVEYQQINYRLQDELIQARQEIERLQKQIAEYVSIDKDRSENNKAMRRYWSPDEHQRFLEAVRKFGHKDVRSIANYVGTRNPTQVRTHAQKYFLRVQRESGPDAVGSQAHDEEGLSNRRRCMSEGDLSKVRRASAAEKTEDREDDPGKDDTQRESANVKVLSMEGAMASERYNPPPLIDRGQDGKDLPSSAALPNHGLDANHHADMSRSQSNAKKPPVHPGTARRQESMLGASYN